MQLEYESVLTTIPAQGFNEIKLVAETMVEELSKLYDFYDIQNDLVIHDSGTTSVGYSGSIRLYIDVGCYMQLIPVRSTVYSSDISGLAINIYSSNNLNRYAVNIAEDGYYKYSPTYVKYRIYSLPTGDVIMIFDEQRNQTYTSQLEQRGAVFCFGSSTMLQSGKIVPSLFYNTGFNGNCDGNIHLFADCYNYSLATSYAQTTERAALCTTYVANTIFCPIMDPLSSIMMNNALVAVYRCNALTSAIEQVEYDNKQWIRIGRFLFRDEAPIEPLEEGDE